MTASRRRMRLCISKLLHGRVRWFCSCEVVRGLIPEELFVVLEVGLHSCSSCIAMIEVVKACRLGQVLGLGGDIPGRSVPHDRWNFGLRLHPV